MQPSAHQNGSTINLPEGQGRNAANPHAADENVLPLMPVSLARTGTPIPSAAPSHPMPAAGLQSAPLFGGKNAEVEISPASEKLTINLDRELVTSVVSRSSRMKGDLETNEGYRIDGEVNGDITAETMILISESGNVKGNIRAERIVVLGTVEGGIHCTGHLIIAKSARINGDVRYRSIITYQGSTIEGSLNRIKD
jgi:cytoskeletal protein CcmA (bactofilin family)